MFKQVQYRTRVYCHTWSDWHSAGDQAAIISKTLDYMQADSVVTKTTAGVGAGIETEFRYTPEPPPPTVPAPSSQRVYVRWATKEPAAVHVAERWKETEGSSLGAQGTLNVYHGDTVVARYAPYHWCAVWRDGDPEPK